MKLRITAVCDVGCERTNNEDMALVFKKIFRDDRIQGSIELTEDTPVFLIAVADGMGGANAGEIASQMVLEGLCEKLYRIPHDLSSDGLKQTISLICENIHKEILLDGSHNPERLGMGSTLAALLWYGDTFYSVHAGDSRLYRFRNGTLMQMMEDHSMRQLTQNSQIPSNVIYNSFGGGNDFFITFDLAGKKYFDGDIFLLCSDGVTDMLSDEEIESILQEEGFEDILLEKCKERGGKDNISYVLAEITEA